MHRGRFNVGEKLLLSVAQSASIVSTTGSVIFDEKGRRRGRKRTEAGSVLTARLRMTREEMADALKTVRTLLPPDGIETWVNGEKLADREVLDTFDATLETEAQGPEGGFAYRYRKTTVRAYAPLPGETPHLYEMGIPVDTIDCPWHVSVEQKVPLSLDRSSVRLGFVKGVQGVVGDGMAAHATEETARETWATAALERMEDDDSVRTLVKARFGKAVTYDPSAPEANKRALDAGYKVVHGGELSKSAWGSVRRAGALEPAGRVFETGKVESKPDGVGPVGRSDWSPAMEAVARYVYAFAEHALGHEMRIEFYDSPSPLGFAAFCGHGAIGLNCRTAPVQPILKCLNAGEYLPYGGKRQRALDELLIHECAHDGGFEHLTDRFEDRLAEIGSRMMRGFHESVDMR